MLYQNLTKHHDLWSRQETEEVYVLVLDQRDMIGVHDTPLVYVEQLGKIILKSCQALRRNVPDLIPTYDLM